MELRRVLFRSARGIVLVEQNRADRIMAYGADAMGEEQPAFVEFDGRAAIADLDELPRIFGLHDHLAEAPFAEVVRQDEVQALIVVEIGRASCRERVCQYV